MTARVLVAGIGNLFLGDDGFGPEVVRRLVAGGQPPDGVRVTDYGIRGMYLAYDLLDGWDALILVDALPATPRVGAESSGGDSSSGGLSGCGSSSAGPSGSASSGGPSDSESSGGGACGGGACGGGACGGGACGARPGEVIVVEVDPEDLETGDFDVHGMQPVAVLSSLTAMGGKLPPTYIVGCPVESVHEGIGLSPAVAAAVPAAIDAVLALLQRLPLTEPLAEPGRS